MQIAGIWALDRARRGSSTTTSIDDPVALVDRPDLSPPIRGLDRLQPVPLADPSWRARRSGRSRTEQLRRSGRRLQLHVARARHACDRPRHRLRIAVEGIEIRAVQVDRQRRREPGDGLLDALGEKRVHHEGHAGKRAPPVPTAYRGSRSGCASARAPAPRRSPPRTRCSGCRRCRRPARRRPTHCATDCTPSIEQIACATRWPNTQRLRCDVPGTAVMWMM